MTDSHDDLIRKDGAYDAPFIAALLEQYKTYVQTADNVSARVVSTGRYLLTLSAALVAAHGFQSSFPHPWYQIALAAAGIGVSILWCRIIKSHSELNGVKFKLIHELEQHLPADLFTREWRTTEGKSYTEATKAEIVIPSLFAVIHALLLIFAVVPIVT